VGPYRPSPGRHLRYRREPAPASRWWPDVTVPVLRPRHRLGVIRRSRRGLVIALSLALAAWQGWWVFTIFWIFVLAVWTAFLMPTWCGAPTRDGGSCRRRARGWLGTCYWHRRAMYKALWAKVRPWNPAADLVDRGACRVRPRRSAPSAAGLLAATAFLLPRAERARFAEEYQSELWELAQSGAPRLFQLLYALHQLRSAPSLGFALRSPHRRSAAP
jgi:hypothetical protein